MKLVHFKQFFKNEYILYMNIVHEFFFYYALQFSP